VDGGDADDDHRDGHAPRNCLKADTRGRGQTETLLGGVDVNSEAPADGPLGHVERGRVIGHDEAGVGGQDDPVQFEHEQRDVFAGGKLAQLLGLLGGLADDVRVTPKEMGVILAIAIALDALVVHLVLLPVLLRVGQLHIWYRPSWLARVLPQVRFSH
jgi:hypothetical protein